MTSPPRNKKTKVKPPNYCQVGHAAGPASDLLFMCVHAPPRQSARVGARTSPPPLPSPGWANAVSRQGRAGALQVTFKPEALKPFKPDLVKRFGSADPVLSRKSNSIFLCKVKKEKSFDSQATSKITER